jgi:2-C-methyl-D-erythritol 4-phosphate cytidylyltransferase/2-C-methyl-D-erythritol 2,4-cyclodiphosphate synthase
MVEPVQIVVVAPSDRLDAARRSVGKSRAATSTTLVVSGGATRQRSVAAGIAALAPSVETVLVHDAARAITPSSLFDNVTAAVRASGTGVIPVLAMSDTIKQTDAAGRVERTLDRSSMVAVQTPQGFPRRHLVAAYAVVSEDFTDDAAVYASAGHSVTVIDGDDRAFKITTASDLRRAEGIVGGGSTVRTGVGIDAHAFEENTELWLGGLFWPGEPGLAGHSDGDALSHAICDALLSAAGLGDIGSRFGVDDPRFAGAHGDVFLEETVRLITDAGYSIGNVAAQLVGNRPKIASRRTELEQNLSAVIGAPVSVAGTTSDGLGFTGTGEGIAVMATALLHRDR